jgi:hypothetical protein
MDDSWSDTDMSTTSSTGSSLALPESLTAYQNILIDAYTLHSSRVRDLMNAVVDLDISVRRERDEQSLPYLADELEEAREELVLHRDAMRRIERDVKKEEERLKRVVGKEAVLAKRQLGEMSVYMGREKVVVCLR